jgi:hypothetical protein
MSKGFLIYAPNSKRKSVIDSAILTALSIKLSQSKYNNVALLTDNKTKFTPFYYDENKKEKEYQVFDKIIEFPFSSKSVAELQIGNIWQIIHATPFEETIFCNNDMVFFRDLYSEFEYMSYFNLLFPTNSMSFNLERNTYIAKHIKECKLPNIWCDIFYFKKTGKSIYEFFNMLEIVSKNWREIYYDIMKSYRPEQQDIHTNVSVAMRLSCYDLLCNIHTDKLNYTKPDQGWSEQYNYFLDNDCNLKIENYTMQSPLKVNDKTFCSEEVLNTYKTMYKIKNERN